MAENVLRSKKKRDPVFSLADKNILLDLVHKNYSIIESKKTDNEAMIAKNECWTKNITDLYNARTTFPRTTAVLKNCWKNLKAEGRKMCGAQQETREKTVNKTDGRRKPNSDVDPLMMRVIDILRQVPVELSNEVGAYSVSASGTIHEDDGEIVEEVSVNEQENHLQKDESCMTGNCWQNLMKPTTPILGEPVCMKIEVEADGHVFSELADDCSGNSLLDNDYHQVAYSSPATEEKGSFYAKISQRQPSTSSARQDTPKCSASSRLTAVDEITPKVAKKSFDMASRHQPTRIRPFISRRKLDEFISKRVEALSSATSHAQKEHEIVMEIHKERLKQERIRTRLLLLELQEAKKRLKN